MRHRLPPVFRRRRSVAGAAIAIAALLVVSSLLTRRFEPYIRQQAIDYLHERFDSEVELGRLTVDVPHIPRLRMLLTGGRGVIAEVTGEHIVLRHKGRRDIPPLFTIAHVRFHVDLGHVFDRVKRVDLVQLDGVEICVPPKGGRPTANGTVGLVDRIVIQKLSVERSRLVILPRQSDRKPLAFELNKVVLTPVQANESLEYAATLNNAMPPGRLHAKGRFGPWNAGIPGETPLSGDYSFTNADLGVFTAIRGVLESTGSFHGTLGAVEAKGVVDVPNFELNGGGPAQPLHADFEAIVDGGNGNTELKPVSATLATTRFTTSGTIFKHDGESRRDIELDVVMPDGEVLDLLTLASKSPPFLAGRINMKAKISIPSGDLVRAANAGRGHLPAESVRNRLALSGTFSIERGQFLEGGVQSKVDTLSRRGQGKPSLHSIANVFSNMSGRFRLENQNLRFENLSFSAPGARVDLAGEYTLNDDHLRFNGSLKLDAKVSQTMTGWKRWALKPVDPFFSRDGAGTFLKIKVVGSSKTPQFAVSR